MWRSKRVRIMLVVVGLLAASAAASNWLARRLSPAEETFVGTWATRPRPQPDGAVAALLLRPDRTCRVRWLDAAGNEKPARPPLNGDWRVQGGWLMADMRNGAGPFRP